jgi:5-methylcytosine-specific restriction endonuclease McrA
VAECSKKHFAKGKCCAHYQAERRRTDPGVQRQVIEANRQWREARTPEERRQYNLNRYHRSRARAAGVYVDETLDVFQVFEEDGYICQECGMSIDRTLRHRNSMMVTLDHIIPLSQGGPHSRENVETTHMRCNVQRRHRLQRERASLNCQGVAA